MVQYEKLKEQSMRVYKETSKPFKVISTVLAINTLIFMVVSIMTGLYLLITQARSTMAALDNR